MSTTWTAAKPCAKDQPEPCCEHDCTSGARNRYFTGKRLSPDALRVEQDYQVERRRLINRAMHGWGVVYGYSVTPPATAKCTAAASGKLTIGPGLALDAMGRELVQTEDTLVSLDDMLELPAEKGDCWMLRVHYAEKLIGPVMVSDQCSHERQQWDRVCETVRYSLQRVSCETCCNAQACELTCHCAADQCSEQRQGPRGGAAHCICQHLTGLQPGAQCSKLTEVAEGVRVDLHNGVALACVKLAMDECEQWTIAEVTDTCGPRRLVKRNDLLFDLIRGCDLTHISFISWADWLAPDYLVPWNHFDKYFSAGVSKLGGCETEFEIAFSRAVRISSVTPGCFAMTFLIRQREGGWLLPMRAPIVRIGFGDLSGEQNELARRARLVVSWGWVSDALRGMETEFERAKVSVEIEIRGDHILDCNGQAVDANARGHGGAPTGNGTPGGTYLSHFDLGPKAPRPDPDKEYAASTDNGGITS
jgi:hypothetical protein